MTRVRLGKSSAFTITPGTYRIFVLYLSAQRNQDEPPVLLDVAQGFAELVIGNRQTVQLHGGQLGDQAREQLRALQRQGLRSFYGPELREI